MDLREILADLCHKQWSGWMKHMFSKCEAGVGGELCIPVKYVMALEKQMDAEYADLSLAEKDSDREEADKFLTIFTEWTPKEDPKDRGKCCFCGRSNFGNGIRNFVNNATICVSCMVDIAQGLSNRIAGH